MTTAVSNGDYIAPSTKRVSYILPPIQHAPRLFQLPSIEANIGSAKGRSGPLLLSSGFDKFITSRPTPRQLGEGSSSSSSGAHPRHTLPVSSLALDTSTILGGSQDGKPSGILYTGGRDGMIGAWELGLRMKRRKVSNEYRMPEEDEQGEDEMESAAGLLDEQTLARDVSDAGIGFGQNEWEVDEDSEKISPTPAAKFRQCIGSHTDWINDIVLCNQNQTVISASSDRSVKIWNPHDINSSLTPQTLGTHTDYVRALAYAPRANWIASGSFDQTIKVWDIKEMRSSPITTIAEPQLKSSVYGLSVNAWGSVIAAASPEKTIQLFDLRSGQRISQLVGHTDNVRSVVLSQDGSHLLSASSDSTIRLWSLSEQRCLHTFTHHNDSVWSLFSNHESLDVFYSGDRSGVVCKVDWERCNEVSEGECVVLAKEKTKSGDAKFNRGSMQDDKAAGIYKIVAADSSYFWTANSNSEVSRWKDVLPRSKREALYPIVSNHYSSKQASATAAPITRPSALKNTPGSSSMVPTTVSFAARPTAASPLSTSYDATPMDISEIGEDKGYQAATLYGLPFDSLVCLAPPNDPYGAAIGLGSISIRGKDRKDATSDQINTVFSSASLISIPSVLRATASSTHRDSFGGGYSPAVDGPASLTTNPFNAHLINAQHRHLDGARPSSTRSASIRFAPPQSYQHRSIDEQQVGSYQQGEDDEVEGEMEQGENDEAALEARQAFEERDSAIDATPLRSNPQDVIHGSHGLIRSSMLNDRRHVLTIDSAGHIFLWDIVSAQCLGAFDWYQVIEAWSHMSNMTEKQAREAHLLPGEALEIVKERIQGEGTTPMWCTVDTKIGALSVHFDYPRCFDAEIYLDELEQALQLSEVDFPYKDDQRVNIAKLVLRNLFEGFIQREARLRSGGDQARLKTQTLAIERPEILLDRPDLRLELGKRDSSKFVQQRSSEAVHTPGMTIALAVPAKTPAVLPISSPLTPKSGMELPGLQQMLIQDRKNNATVGGGSVTADDQAGSGMGDYFSLAKGAGSSDKQPQTPQAKTPLAGASSNVLNSPGSPGGSGLMGRLRMSMKRGDQKKEEKVEPSTPLSKGLAMSIEDEEEGKGSTSTETKQLLESIRKVMTKADPAKLLEEMPQLRFPPLTAIMITESSPDATVTSTSQIDYRGLVKSTGNDLATLEVNLPTWLLEFLMGASDNSPPLKEKDKLTFLLVPWEASDTVSPSSSSSRPKEKMPAMPTGNSRLTATKMLRVKKACSYVADKLNILDDGNPEVKSRASSIIASRRSSTTTEPQSSNNVNPSSPRNPFLSMTSSLPNEKLQQQQQQQHTNSIDLNHGGNPNIEAHEILEILCNGTIIAPHCTLSQVQRYYWKSSNVIKLEYRWKEER